jgi:hypothetical protein
MCATTVCTLNLAALLKDPLIRLVMSSDNVSETDYSALLFRVRETLIARASMSHVYHERHSSPTVRLR